VCVWRGFRRKNFKDPMLYLWVREIYININININDHPLKSEPKICIIQKLEPAMIVHTLQTKNSVIDYLLPEDSYGAVEEYIFVTISPGSQTQLI
jgi:hypothetical protein